MKRIIIERMNEETQKTAMAAIEHGVIVSGWLATKSDKSTGVNTLGFCGKVIEGKGDNPDTREEYRVPFSVMCQLPQTPDATYFLKALGKELTGESSVASR